MVRPLLPVVLALLAVPLASAGSGPAAPAPSGPVASAPDLDSARSEVAVGRYWHASRHLRDLRSGGLEFGPRETLLLARADAGWRNWGAVVEELAESEWLAREEGGFGLLLLGHAHAALEAWSDAADAYGRYLASPHGLESAERPAVLARRAAALDRAGRADDALAVLDSLAARSSVVASWQAFALAGSAATAGDTTTVRLLLADVSDPAVLERAWRLEASAVLASGDTARATRLYEALAEDSGAPARRAAAFDVLASLALARGDTAGAVARSRTALDLGPGTGAGVAAARRLVRLDSLGAGRALAAARVLDRAGADADALAAYDLHVEVVDGATESVRLARAHLLATTSGRHDQAVTELRALSTSDDVEVGAGALETWAALRRRQGRADDVRTLREWLVERYPSSPEAVEYVFLRGDAAHDRGELDAALRDYRRLQEMEPTLSRSGLARMRAAQIHLARGDSAESLDVFRGYLADFPEGRRWEEAAYWAGRILQDRGETEEGAGLFRRIREEAPLSYYAVLASEALGVPFELPGAPGGGVPPLPEWMAAELATVDLLSGAGLEDGRAARTDALGERALDTSHAAALRLARELIARDHTLDGINLGWELRRRGMPWSRALLEVTYPLPHRELVYRAARARDLDPILVASLVRQESAFDPDIVSHAGAVGLMQIMPATGRQLAAAVGPEDFNRESLETPEINLHLGTRYLVELLDRFDGSLPLVLSAYNAGPHRASTWMEFPEADDPLRFTERIPYGETREYVRLVTRNVALYRALYGDRPVS